METALITGVTGQDGSYLAEMLLNLGYKVHGLVRRSSTPNTGRIDHLIGDSMLQLHYGDLCDGASLRRVLDETEPTEVYNLGAMSHVKVSFDVPEYAAQATGVSSMSLLEALRQSGSKARFYQASSSELFGSSPPPQSEATPFHPRSPYGCAKAYAFYATVNYREAYGMHASNGILFNHESPRRGENFVTRKITQAVARIARGRQNVLRLGNISAKRDWGHASDFVRAMHAIVRYPTPDDYVIATGETHTVQEFVEIAFACIGRRWQDYVRIDESLYRPAEVDVLLGDSSKARRILGWEPRITFKQLVEIMVAADLEAEK